MEIKISKNGKNLVNNQKYTVYLNVGKYRNLKVFSNCDSMRIAKALKKNLQVILNEVVQ